MGMKMYTNELDHMTEVATMLKHLKVFFSRTNGLMAMELGL